MPCCRPLADLSRLSKLKVKALTLFWNYKHRTTLLKINRIKLAAIESCLWKKPFRVCYRRKMSQTTAGQIFRTCYHWNLELFMATARVIWAQSNIPSKKKRSVLIFRNPKKKGAVLKGGAVLQTIVHVVLLMLMETSLENHLISADGGQTTSCPCLINPWNNRATKKVTHC